jgi:PKHD-type hydroxylase
MLYPIQHRNPPTRTHKAYWEGFLTPDEINFILAQPEWLKTATGVVADGTGKTEQNAESRITDVGWLGPKPELMPIWDKFSALVAEVNRQYFQFDLTGLYEPMQLGVYTGEKGGHYSWHTDTGMNDVGVPRKLSVVLCLSDPSEFEGGELQLMDSKGNPETLELKKGRAWFFPSFLIHRVTPVTKGVRRSIVLWVGGPAFK